MCFDFNIIKNLFLKLSIGKKKKNSIGILNKGRDNKFINNKVDGFDIGMKDEGKNTEARNNKFKK